MYGVVAPEGGLDDTGRAVAEALAAPIGSPCLRDVARGCTNVVIISDDATRLTPVSLILPHVVEELDIAGVARDNLTIVMANGTHRAMTPEEIKAKLGEEFASSLRVENHDYKADDLVSMGSTPSGVPVMINRTVASADLVIGIGAIIPHRYCGWSGGAKIVQPGVCGEATTVATHLMITKDPGVRLGNVENVVRHEMEAVAERAGLKFIVNAVVSARGDVVSVVAGDPVLAHRAGVARARQVCAARVPERADVVVASSFPADINFWQAGKAFYTSDLAVKDGGVIVLVTPAFEGIGEHPEFGGLIPRSRGEVLGMLDAGMVVDKLAAAAALAVRLVADRAKIIVVTDGLTEDEVRRMGFEHFGSGELQSAVERAVDIAAGGCAGRDGAGCDAGCSAGGATSLPTVTVLREAPDTLPVIENEGCGCCG